MHYKRGVLCMKLKYLDRNLELADALKEQAEKKSSKLDRYFQEGIRAKITSFAKKGYYKVETTVFLPDRALRIEEGTDDMHVSMDITVQALEGQIRKYKIKLRGKCQSNDGICFENFEQEEPEADEENPDGQSI